MTQSQPPGSTTLYQMTIPAGAKTTFVTGTFKVSSGTGNTVEVLLMDESNYDNWHGGYRSSPFGPAGDSDRLLGLFYRVSEG